MSTRFHTLFSIAVNHGYYSNNCKDIQYVLSDDAKKILRNGKLLHRIIDGQLHVLYEADSGGTPLRDVSGGRIQIGLQLANPLFSQFTQFSIPKNAWLIYKNQNSVTALDAPLETLTCSTVLRHTLVEATRPVTVGLNNDAGQLAAQSTVAALNGKEDVDFLMESHPPGVYQVLENYPLASYSEKYAYYPELMRRGVWGVCDIQIDAGFYTTPAQFEIAFLPVENTLKYYVVAKNYSDADYSNLAVTDAGFSEQGRAQIVFDRIEPASFSGDEIAPSLIKNNSDKLVLFKSQTAVARLEQVHKKIQLNLNGDVLIPNLPAPGASKAQADFIIHVAKP
ncbi:hypothetical protein QFX18_16015 [Saccharophagus degradans]|uniref:hypothetical protein n=1 Tax=Saccharophagus degradans TaxID=86304 RepID=UPI00247810CB|nr:hypothetical protein [Saccharophagus degradans]WGO97524.1 hypothetical protein QFX18_16015 [Saccharophagus degradans]